MAFNGFPRGFYFPPTCSNPENEYSDALAGIKRRLSALEIKVDNIQALPNVTTENNGDFLTVVDGVWSASSIPFAENSYFGGVGGG